MRGVSPAFFCSAARAFCQSAELLDGGGADAQLDEVQRHGLLPNDRTAPEWTAGAAPRRAQTARHPQLVGGYFAVHVPAYCANDRLAEHAEVARVDGRIGAAGGVLVVDRRQIEEALVDDLEKVVGVDRAHDLQRGRACRCPRDELRRLLIEIDVGDRRS